MTSKTMPSDAPASGHRLDSWKAIADYLQRDVRTVRRWEQGRGLPVRRVPGGRGTSVYAYTTEIDAWLREAPPAVDDEPPELPVPTRRPWQYAWLPAVSLGVVATLTVVAWNKTSDPLAVEDLRIEVTDRAINGLDPAGRPVWKFALDPDHRAVTSDVGTVARVVAGDDPAVYAAIALAFRRVDETLAGGELRSFTLDGTPRWSFTFADRIAMQGRPFGPPWMVTTFAVGDFRPRRIAVAAHHAEWGASLVAVLDDAGQRLGTFTHSGWIEGLHWLAPDRLVVAGFSDAHDGGMIGLIDPTAPDAQGPEPPGSPNRCEACGQGTPLRMIVMPRTEVNRATVSRFNRAVLQVAADRIVARTIEVPSDGQGAVDVVYQFTPGLEFVSASFSDRYWDAHRALERQGRLDHSRERCPDRDGPRGLEIWTPTTGWTQQATQSQHIK